MNNTLRIVLYLVLTFAAVWFGYNFYRTYSLTPPAAGFNALEEPDETTAAPSPASTPPPATATQTNDPSQPAEDGAEPATNETVAADAASSTTDTNAAARPAAPPSAGTGKSFNIKRTRDMVVYLCAFVASLAGLGLLVAREVSHYMGGRAVKFLYNDEGEGVHDPEYEDAEKTWADGHPLEAVQMMRDYLKKNPREQHVALRIAEIYEKDLKNYLAAALEYEEVLTKKLPPERWGWAAIHLCNLYNKLNKTDQAVALLRRIDQEYGDTAAAGKARQRLAMFETVGDAALEGELPDTPPAPHSQKAAPPAEPKSNLPPGFRPKKK